MPPTNHHSDQSDAALLRRFAVVRDDPAFAALVERYAGLVYGVAMRRAGQPLADEVVQNVFGILARKATALDASRGLGGWLHKVASREAANVARKEQRRNRAMRRYAAETLEDGETAPDPDLLPLLDDALAALGGGDRQLIVMRFFESLSFREIGQRLGASEEAGRKRVSRAMDKLAKLMRRRAGRAVPVASLATLLGASLNTKVPAAVVAAASSVGAGISVPAATSAFTVFTLMKTSQVAFASALVLAAALPVAVQWHASARSFDRISPASSSPGAAAGNPSARPRSTRHPHPTLQAATAGFRTGKNDPKLDLQKLAAAIARIDENGEPAELLLQLAAQLYTLSETDIPAVGDLLASAANARHLGTLVTAYFSRWAEFTPRIALEATKSERWRDLARNARIEAAQTWAASDPAAAVEWCEAQEGDIHGSILKMCVFRKWAIADPDAALARAAELPGGRALSYRKTLVAVWAHHDPEGAVAWAQRLEDETDRIQLVEYALENLSQQNAASGFTLASSLKDPLLRRDALRYAFMQWRFQPEACARGFLSLPEADRSDALANDILGWLRIAGPGRQESNPERTLRDWLARQERETEGEAP